MSSVSATKVLIVDDNRDAADLLSDYFSLKGHTTRVEYGGTAGLAAVIAFGPSVVFLDLGMPAPDGYETARRIRALSLLLQPRLVAFTAWGDDETRSRVKLAGFDAHVVKPAALDLLLLELTKSPGPHSPVVD